MLTANYYVFQNDLAIAKDIVSSDFLELETQRALWLLIGKFKLL